MFETRKGLVDGSRPNIFPPKAVNITRRHKHHLEQIKC